MFSSQKKKNATEEEVELEEKTTEGDTENHKNEETLEELKDDTKGHNKHTKETETILPSSCSICEETFENLIELEMHNKTEHQSSEVLNFECDYPLPLEKIHETSTQAEHSNLLVEYEECEKKENIIKELKIQLLQEKQSHKSDEMEWIKKKEEIVSEWELNKADIEKELNDLKRCIEVQEKKRLKR